MPNDSHRPDVAVFIDFENVYVSVRDKLDANPNFESIMDRCEDLGRVVIARAYADWYRYPRVTSALYANSIEPMYVPTYYYDREMGRTGRPIKNSVDMNLCVDAMKTLYTNPNIEKFVLATGDRDFIPLVNTIRQQGKDVIVIGIGGAASAHLAQSADEFIFYEALVGKKTGGTIDDVPRAKMPEKGREGYEHSGSDETPNHRRSERENGRSEREREHAAPTPVSIQPAPTPAPAEPAQPDIYDTLVKAIHLARERGYVCSFGSLKLLMKELMGGDFKESRYKDVQGRPFAKFKDFVLEGERRGRVQVFTNGTVNEVFLPGEDPYKLSQFAAELKVDTDPDLPAVEATTVPAATDQRGERAGSTGRRRRRRRPGRQSDRNAEGTFEDATEEFEVESLESAPLPDLPDLPEETRSDEVFEELLERIETEDARYAQAAEEPAEVAAPVAQQPVAQQPVDESAEEQPTLAARPFEEGDWTFLRAVVGSYGKPASFAQIHDLLRGARNQQSITRTNEELRSLVKQAINNGLLMRQGKGNRISYRLNEAAPETAEATAEANDQTAIIEQASQEAQSEPTLDGLTDAAQLASDPAQAQAEAATIQQQAEAIALEPSSELSGVAAIEPVEQKRPARRRKPAAKAEPAAEALAPAPAPEEPKPAPKRTQRRKPAAKAEPAAEAPAPAPAPEEPKPAPKRTQRRRKPSTTEE